MNGGFSHGELLEMSWEDLSFEIEAYNQYQAERRREMERE